MWEIARDLTALVAGLLFPLVTGLIARWTLGMSSPRKDLVTARRLCAATLDWWSATWHRAGLWIHAQMGFTDLKLQSLKRRIEQGQYKEDLAL